MCGGFQTSVLIVKPGSSCSGTGRGSSKVALPEVLTLVAVSLAQGAWAQIVDAVPERGRRR